MRVRFFLISALILVGAFFASHYIDTHPHRQVLPALGGDVAEAELPEISATPIALSDYSLVIPQLSLDVPIILNVSGRNQADYLAALLHGVAHYQGTALPGNPGNSFIFGHSYFRKGGYAEVFAHIDKLKNGDQFTIKHGTDPFNYLVFRTEIVSDKDLSVLNQGRDEIVTLMTCWPPKTTEKRYVVQAKRIK
jgi:LPXTG-site transpeptidase (sortase) family protein